MDIPIVILFQGYSFFHIQRTPGHGNNFQLHQSRRKFCQNKDKPFFFPVQILTEKNLWPLSLSLFLSLCLSVKPGHSLSFLPRKKNEDCFAHARSAVQAAVHFVRTVFHFRKKQDRETEIHGRFKPVFQTREIFRSFLAKGRFWKSDGEILTALEGQGRSGGPEGLRKVGEL